MICYSYHHIRILVVYVLFTRQKRTEVFLDGQLKLFGYHKLGKE